MVQIYCGNNAMDINLLNGNMVLGTRYGCLRQGVGVGLNLPYDPKYNGAYMPIDQRSTYCGNQDILPAQYDIMGNLPQCLAKGVGIGKRQRALQGLPHFILFRYISPIILFVIILITLFIYLFLSKPSIVTTKDSDNIKRINWSKFMAFYIPVMALIGVIIFLFWRFG